MFFILESLRARAPVSFILSKFPVKLQPDVLHKNLLSAYMWVNNMHNCCFLALFGGVRTVSAGAKK